MSIEEATITVSETHVSTYDGDTLTVKEASSPQQLESPPIVPPAWKESQEAKDFEPFLLEELKRIKPPNECARSHNEAERALGQYRRLDGRISKALQSDDDGVLNISNIDKCREIVEKHIEAIERMLNAHHDMKKRRKQVRRRASDGSTCPKCAEQLWESDEGKVCVACEETLKKEAGTPVFNGFSTQISAFENAITNILINATVSNGRDMEELYKKLKDKYKFTDREELAILQILEDKGYPIFKDRARLGEDEDPTDPKKTREWMTQYYA